MYEHVTTLRLSLFKSLILQVNLLQNLFNDLPFTRLSANFRSFFKYTLKFTYFKLFYDNLTIYSRFFRSTRDLITTAKYYIKKNQKFVVIIKINKNRRASFS